MKSKTLTIIDDLFKRHIELIPIRLDIVSAIETLIISFQAGNKLLCCGNGGSASDCEHIVGELMKGFVLPRKIDKTLTDKLSNNTLSNSLQNGLPTISLVSQVALLTAYSNDKLPEGIFAQQVLGYGKENDVLLCISTSGNSKNCVYAAQIAKALNLKVISLTGKNESMLSSISDVCIKAPEEETYKIQELHVPIYHTICMALENEFFGDSLCRQ